jgi:hypothetical protein
MRLCENCNILYDSQTDQCGLCKNGLAEIDPLLAETIQMLNKRGYKTKFCCQGHTNTNPIQSYIMFDDEVDLPNYPIGYTYRYPNIINKIFYSKTNHNLEEEIRESAKKLYEWSKNLPLNRLNLI